MVVPVRSERSSVSSSSSSSSRRQSRNSRVSISEDYGALIEEKYVALFSVAATQVAPVICGPWCLVLSPIIAQDVAKDYPNAYIPEKKKVPGLLNYVEMDNKY